MANSIINSNSHSFTLSKNSRYSISTGYLVLGLIISILFIILNNSGLSIVEYPFINEILYGTIIASTHLGFSLFAYPGNPSTKINRSIFGLLSGTLIFYIILILFGAPFLKSVHTTFFYGYLLSAMCVVPPSILLGSNPQNWKELFLNQNHSNIIETCCVIVVVSSLLMSWVGAFPIPLDWDRPWQVWPISCVYSSMFGHILGLFISTIYSLLYKEKKSK
ncbi:hypothetical protein DICPUDRAFT_83760 [Dictyostelium purpureum]|uniref:Phosphatidylinositol-glycan biosynthesis class F protein n=1 Tax=Dictyostelium purpureum TaxID=5786 RepID=F1A0J2_DICPU|nr:uncharacterized protein DICPUDRAFT_83760 [Dictyostelium purpureum]EGC30282.1 hypothetical protein DICPUDRAFT_83760 [Dictyostelium purpureum]|eukprot:XP_003293185.1 hypothetical protein DICPUDRAFT_83760 [Dictyostelium purpureum]